METSQGNEAEKIKWEIVKYTRGFGVDLGCGVYKPFQHFIGIDNVKSDDYWYRLNVNIVSDCRKLDFFNDGQLDFVFSSHLLEHIEDYKAALKEWWRVIKNGGYLVLYLPHKYLYPNIGEPGANTDHKHDFLPEDITDAMPDGFELCENQVRDNGNEYSFYQVYKKVESGRILRVKEGLQEKTCAVVRYGGYGDMLQMSPIFAGLKGQGYKVTLYTTERVYDIVKNDPNIDDFYLQDTDQVKNHELPLFWQYHSRKYDKFINFSECVEGTFLCLPGRTVTGWNKDIRHELCNKNYLEVMHKIAGIEYALPSTVFYATEEELARMRGFRSGIHGRVILWSLSGSSVHKTWPYLDQVIARMLLTYKDVFFVLVGDEVSAMLEAGWQAEPRVFCTSGEWKIREVLNFACNYADIVVGCETGVLNAVAFLPMPKLLFLSHSSIENLSRDWQNCYSFMPDGCSCYPCHLMHYGWDLCKRDEVTGVADCQAKINPESVISILNRILGDKNDDIRSIYRNDKCKYINNRCIC